VWACSSHRTDERNAHGTLEWKRFLGIPTRREKDGFTMDIEETEYEAVSLIPVAHDM
jgi:hypothetical protein